MAKEGEKKGAGYQKRHSVDQHRQGCARAKLSINDARADIDAAGDAANGGRGEIANSKTHKEPIAVAARFAGRRYELGGQQRVD